MASNGRPTRSAAVGAASSSGTSTGAVKVKGTKERTQFKPADYLMLVDWLVLPDNLDAIRGAEGKTKVGPRHPKKKDAYDQLAEYLNTHQSRGSNLKHVTQEGAKNRYQYIHQKYKDIKKAKRRTGYGLTVEDTQAEITIMAQKQEKDCPGFWRLDKLLGGSPVMNMQENLHSTPLSQVVPDSLPIPSLEIVEDDLCDEDPFSETKMDPNLDLDDPHFEILNQVPAPKSVPCTFVPNQTTSMPASEKHAMPDPSLVVDERPYTPRQAVKLDNPTGGLLSRKQKSFEYPNKKQVNDSQNSLNSSFAAHLDTIVQQRTEDGHSRADAVDIQRQQLQFDRQLQMERMEQDRLDRQTRFNVQAALEEKKLALARETKRKRQEEEVNGQQLEVMKLESELKQTELKLAAGNKNDARQAKLKVLQDMQISGEKPLEDIRALMSLLD